MEILLKTMGKNHEEIRRVTRFEDTGNKPEEMSFFLDLTSANNAAQ